MIRATLDTNVLASGFLGGGGPPHLVLMRWDEGDFELIISEAILRELARTLDRTYFRDRLTPRRVAANVARLRTAATMVSSPGLTERVATHPEDDLVLSTDVTGRADYLVTGDARFRRVETYRGVTLLTPREFLALLDARNSAHQTGGEDDTAGVES